ncbi:MAG TPA: sigma-54-dependent Fis family transcriptional regulator, partial [Deltaproteobacteria bacterium]|nr:sigma-54-dependent Fis family transcriptional regulator [Deltaproteobacteria bacterium]
RAANAFGSVLITGETGTGKELFAKAVHANSPRYNQPFITIDCTNITSTLAESLLFGHCKGSFTGADRDSEGMILQADKGTLFLDEVGDLPVETQKSFLRVLQNKSFRPLGSATDQYSDFRLVAATNKNLQKEISAGRFREDLYFRLSTFHIHLPPLRQRKDDIRLLAAYCIETICKEMAITTKGMSGDFIEALRKYSWPGNIRELHGLLRAAVANCIGESTLFPHALPTEFRIQILKDRISDRDEILNGSFSSTPEGEIVETRNPISTYKAFRLHSEALYVKQLMESAGGNIKKAISVSGMSRARLYQLLQKHGLLPGQR